MINKMQFPKTEQGNDPADHVGDDEYKAAVIKGIAAAASTPDPDPLAWVNQFTISDEEAEMFAHSKFIIDGLIPENHLIAIVGPPGAGKTTITQALSADMVKAGFKVIYVNADIAAGDASDFRLQCMKHGVIPLFPDMKVGRSMVDVVKSLEATNHEAANLTGSVFVIDTLKKACDVINKGAVKRLLCLFRALTGKGATVIVLGHTNKYDGPDGKPIFEGTGDIKSDVDELIYLVPHKNDDGSMTVSMEPDKTRAAMVKATFRISPERAVKRLDHFVDVKAQQRKRDQLDKDQDTIEVITAAIDNGEFKQSMIVAYCKKEGVSRKKVLDCLKRYSKGEVKLWNETPALERNAKLYSLVRI